MQSLPSGPSFGSLCRDKSGGTDRVRTVEALLDVAGTTDCATAERFLRGIPSLSLKAKSIVDLLPLEIFTNLRALDLSGNPRVTDVASLRYLTQLETLDLSDTGVTDTAPLLGLSRLTRVRLARTPVKSVVPLRMLPLRLLDLSGTRVTDWSTLPTTLEVLRLSDVHGTNPSMLSRLRTLRGLDVANTGLRDLHALGKLVALNYLVLDRNSVYDVRPLAALVNLQHLSLRQTLVADLSTLDPYLTLQTLWIANLPARPACPRPWLCRDEANDNDEWRSLFLFDVDHLLDFGVYDPRFVRQLDSESFVD